MKYFVLTWLMIYSLPLKAEAPRLSAYGQLDLSDWQADQSALELHGSWYFFWDEHLSPSEALERLETGELQQFFDPGTGFASRSPDAKAQGIASYLLQIKGLKSSEQLGIGQYSAYTASRLFLFSREQAANATPLIEVGRPGKSSNNTVPRMTRSEIKPFAASGDDLFVLIHVSNFHHEWGGLWIPPSIGNYEALIAQQAKRKYPQYLIFGTMVTLMIFNLSLWIQRHEDKASLFLSLFCLVLAIRYFMYSDLTFDFLFQVQSRLSFELQWRGIYLTNSIGFPLFLSFLYASFPGHISKRLLQVYWVVGAFLFISQSSNIMFYGNYLLLLSKIWLLLSLPVVMFIGYSIIKQKVIGSRFMLIGGVMLALGSLVEVLDTLGIPKPFDALNISLLGFLFMQSQIVGVRFAMVFRTVEKLNKNLQLEVDRQTRDIKLILKHIKQGIFTINDDMKIEPGYSDFMHEIFETDDLGKKTFDELMLEHSNLTSDQINEVNSALLSCIGEPSFAFEANAGLLPATVQFQSPRSQQTKHIELEWVPINDSQDQIEKVLVTARDMTLVKELEEKSRQQSEEINIMIEILGVHPEKFQNFIKQSKAFITYNKELIKLGSQDNQEILKMLFINMHTLKGLARTFRLKQLSDMSHKIEQRYAAIQNNTEVWNESILMTELEELHQAILKYETIESEKIGRSNADEMIQLPLRDSERWIREIDPKELKSNNPLMELYSQIFNQCFVSIDTVLEDLIEHTRILAKDLGKLKPKVLLEGDPIRFSRKGADLLRSILVHLIRNSMDHGIEVAEERLKHGKPAEGRISIRLSDAGEDVLLSYKDDGQGLDLPKIREIAIRRGLIDEQQQISAEELSMLIFQSGFSTANAVTDISGRGVGMDAVRRHLSDEGGELWVELLDKQTELKQTHFVIHMRLPQTYCSIHHMAAA